jgi:tetratricopeptide (TPR) repeat protein
MGRIIPALLLALLPTGLLAAEPKPAYVGAARLYSLDRVSVVYPAGPGEDVEVNRISAERRAAFLRRDHGIETFVVADGEVDDETLSGNLLLLGWNNRLLGRKEAPAPFLKSSRGRRFLGSAAIKPGEDLLFAHVSPFNPDKQLVFWSRIDLDGDRSFILPFLGSDWAVYRDFFIVAQGMFAEGAAWPPARNPNAEKSNRSEMQDFPAQQSSKHFTLHHRPGGIDANMAAAILETRETALAAAAGLLGQPPEEFRIALYVYKHGEHKEAQTGVATNAHSIVSRRESHMTLRRARSDDPGQELLLLAGALLGPCTTTALCDGLAVSLTDAKGESALPAYAAQMMEHDSLPSLADLLDEDKLRSMNRVISMPAIGLLARWLHERGALREAWKSRDLTVVELAAALELEPDVAEAEFGRYVAGLAKGIGDELAFRQALGEAQLQYERGDTVGMAEALEQASSIRPDDPDTLYKLALALKQAGKNARAEKHFLRLIELEVAPSASRYVIFGHYQLGRLYEDQGKEKKAREAFEKMLELPDEHEAHRKAREALDRL